ncbi:MAG: 3',5'-cyclic-nucleotide phosphodiesterase, partial [Candidatus Firestonebacteria bacterium]|nr:3',5'-cyclic-nucleotide phosphodiesterase [Candidatus Firestonebacteria bacterium]
ITHAHLDHVNALPFLLDNLIGRVAAGVDVYGSAETVEALRRHIFNGVIWPDFTVLPKPDQAVLRLHAVSPGEPFPVGPYMVEAVAVNHSVPTLAYLIEGPDGTVAFSGDTGPTENLWHRLSQIKNLRAIFLETSFPTSHAELAGRTRHLCVEDVGRELAKIGHSLGLPVYLYHLKPEYQDVIKREVDHLAAWKIRLAVPGETIKITAPA